MDSALRASLAVGVVGCVALALPVSASAASMAVVPKRGCYRAEEQVVLGGGGFTPNNRVEVTVNRKPLRAGFAKTNAQGAFAGALTFGTVRGERKRLLAATDQANPGNFATLNVRVTDVAVSVTPRRAAPGRRVRVNAHGFTASKRLYAHIRRGRRFSRNVRVGRLKRACRKLDRRIRIFSIGARAGVYNVQFDGKRRYSKRTAPRIRYDVTIFRRLVRGSLASASALQSWVRLP